MVLAQHRTDLPNDTRYVVILQHKQHAYQQRLAVPVVDPNNTPRGANERARDGRFLIAEICTQFDQIVEFAGRTLPGFNDFKTQRLRQRSDINLVNFLASYFFQETFQDIARDRRSLGLIYLTAIIDVQLFTTSW